MKAKQIQFKNAYRFPGFPHPQESLNDVDCQREGSWLAVDCGDEVHWVPSCHVKVVIVARDEIAKGKGK